MSNKVIVGLGYGDEGKGVVTEYLCSQDPENTIVVRFSGGQQAGHKVIKGDIEHVFSSFGSGTLSGCPTYWSKYCTFDPVSFWNEYVLLKEKGVTPRIYVHPDCAVTTPYDVFANRKGKELKHGTTGTGFFKTKERHMKGTKFTVSDLFLSPFLCWDTGVRYYYGFSDSEEKELVDFLFAFGEASANIKTLLGRSLVITDTIPNFKHKVFEGSQGLMLDEHIGTMPHCTPSDITPKPILDMGYDIDEIFLVTRAYQTRHGNGPMTNEDHPVDLVNNEKETNISHEYQGDFRKTVLDLDQLLHAKTKGIDEVVPEGTKVNLVITCIDQVSQIRVSRGGIILPFYSAKPLRFISDFLGINGDLYVNDSPYSTSIKKVLF